VYCYDGAQAVAFDPADTGNVVEGQLLTPVLGVDVNGVTCDSVFRLLYDRLQAEYDLDTCAAICGIDRGMIETLAAEFAAHGKKSCAEAYRGAVQHTNGVYNMLAIIALNIVAGNVDWKGGISFGGGHYHEVGGGAAGQVGLKSAIGNATPYSPVGPRFDRAGVKYEDYPNLVARDGYPAKRPWFPIAWHGVCQEIYAGAMEKYPYPVGVMFSYWLDWAYTMPAAKKIANRVLRDESLVPVHVAIDIEFSETSTLADYILPDTTYLERWSTPHAAPTMLTKFSGFRQPVVGSFDPSTGEYFPGVGDPSGDPEYSPLPLEEIFTRLGKALAQKAGRTFPGIGDNGWDVSAGGSTTEPWHQHQNTAWDYWANVLNNYEIESGHTAASIRAHGGAFEAKGNEYDGEKLMHRYNFKAPLHFYSETLAKTLDSMRSSQSEDKRFDPLPGYKPIADFLDRPVVDAEYPFTVVTWKPVQHTQGRTAWSPTLMMLEPENMAWMNSADARALGLETGDTIRISSATCPEGVVGKVYVTEGIRPGVIGVSNSFGHWELSSRPHEVDGKPTGFDPRRGKGFTINPVLREDPSRPGVVLTDKVGGSASYYDTRVRVEKVWL
ncbi:MAG: hypothetical protein D6806_12040, partial [Deltaproteobacteria bacterium]